MLTNKNIELILSLSQFLLSGKGVQVRKRREKLSFGDFQVDATPGHEGNVFIRVSVYERKRPDENGIKHLRKCLIRKGLCEFDSIKFVKAVGNEYRSPLVTFLLYPAFTTHEGVTMTWEVIESCAPKMTREVTKFNRSVASKPQNAMLRIHAPLRGRPAHYSMR